MSSKAHRMPPTGASAWEPWRPKVAPSIVAARVPTADDTLELEPLPAGPGIDDQIAGAYASGLADGGAAAASVIEAERARVADTLAELTQLRRVVLEAADRDLIRLAVGMARRVLHREVQLDPDILLAMARVALGRLGDRAVARVYLNPADLAAVTRAAAGDALTLVADPELPPGGCRIAAATGEIDLGVDSQMSEIARVLLGDAAEANHARLH